MEETSKVWYFICKCVKRLRGESGTSTRWVRPCLRAEGSRNSSPMKREAHSIPLGGWCGSRSQRLNSWINDPILRPEVLKKVMASDRYSVEFNEEGNPFQIIEVKADG